MTMIRAPGWAVPETVKAKFLMVIITCDAVVPDDAVAADDAVTPEDAVGVGADRADTAPAGEAVPDGCDELPQPATSIAAAGKNTAAQSFRAGLML